jgi:hypothetical protein
MPRYTQLETARLRRDLGLARARRITVYAGVGAAGLTAVIALVAATTAPGRSLSASSAAAQADSNGQQTSGVSSPEFVVPGQPPIAGNGGVPIAVSGGS